jgi:import inner membrane translocase subunit TIM44
LQTYSQLAHPIQQAKALGLQFHSRILDIDSVDVSASVGRPPEGGWKLLVTVNACLTQAGIYN